MAKYFMMLALQNLQAAVVWNYQKRSIRTNGGGHPDVLALLSVEGQE